MNLAPIILFVYNRPWHTKQTLEALQNNELAIDSELFIYSDGPQDTDESKTAVTEVRKYLKEIGGFKKVTITESSKNLGLADSIINGVSEIVYKYGRVIVLEDDLITTSDFLYYMNQALKKYADDKQVMQISGHMFDVNIDAETDAIFLPFTTSWGWATWKRAWENLDQNSMGYEKLKTDQILRNKFNLNGAYDYFQMLEAQIKGKVDSWAIRWYLSVFRADGLVLYPVQSLVRNIGFDGSGTNCGASVTTNKHVKLCAKELSRQNNFPELAIDEDVYQKVKLLLTSNRTILMKLKTLSSKFLKKLGFSVNN